MPLKLILQTLIRKRKTGEEMLYLPKCEGTQQSEGRGGLWWIGCHYPWGRLTDVTTHPPPSPANRSRRKPPSPATPPSRLPAPYDFAFPDAV
ncbi:hypothetical protein BHM03_00056589 [Ensete ventricosum]|nr:hypothetical protein BHM03_00056589 [Ensete ventricosum]